MQANAVTRTAGKVPLLRRAAVWLQIGISFALLVSMGALVRSFINTRTQNIGITRNQVLAAFTQDPDNPMRDAVIANLRAMPGVAERSVRNSFAIDAFRGRHAGKGHAAQPSGIAQSC